MLGEVVVERSLRVEVVALAHQAALVPVVRWWSAGWHRRLTLNAGQCDTAHSADADPQVVLSQW